MKFGLIYKLILWFFICGFISTDIFSQKKSTSFLLPENKAYKNFNKFNYFPPQFKPGFLDTLTHSRKKSINLMPMDYYFGTNYAKQAFKNKFSTDTFDVESIGLEAGLGYYVYDMNNDIFWGWSIYGASIGMEYKVPFTDIKKLESELGKSYKQVNLNARIEGTIGLFLELGLHGQLGYSTNFTNHYLKPGFGLALLNLQFGAEIFVPLNLRIPNYYNYYGFYARWIFAEPNTKYIEFFDKVYIPAPHMYWYGGGLIGQKTKNRYKDSMLNITYLTFELGTSWGKYKYDYKWRDLFSYLGAGVGLEYRDPLNKITLQDSSTMSFDRPIYANIRCDGAFGIFGKVSLNGHVGYNTNSLYHYFRPGLGIAIDDDDKGMNVEFGVEKFIHIKHQQSSISAMGYYVKVNLFSFD